MKKQIDMVKFLLKYSGKWHIFAKDRETIETICACHNLGILKIKGDMMILKSKMAALQFLNNRGVT